MDLRALRAMAITLNWDVLGVDVTVTPPGGDPIETRGIWVTPLTEQVPVGLDFTRAERRRVIALKKADVPSAPRATVILAPESGSDTAVAWRVDGTDRIEAEHVRVTVVPAPDLDS